MTTKRNRDERPATETAAESERPIVAAEAAPASIERPPAEWHEAKQDIPGWAFAAALGAGKWSHETALTEAQFDAAIMDARGPRTVEAWRDVLETPAWAFAAAKMLHGWAIGRVLSETDYGAAIEAASKVRISGHQNPPTRRKRK